MTLPISILLLIAAGRGLSISGLYRDTAVYIAQEVGQDFVSLFVVLPTLIITAYLASRGSSRAQLVWLGASVYLVYAYATAAFEYRFNSYTLFLAYLCRSIPFAQVFTK